MFLSAKAFLPSWLLMVQCSSNIVCLRSRVLVWSILAGDCFCLLLLLLLLPPGRVAAYMYLVPAFGLHRQRERERVLECWMDGTDVAGVIECWTYKLDLRWWC